MKIEKLNKNIQVKKDAVEHFKGHLKKFESREVEPPKNLVTDEEKDEWFNRQISALKTKIKYEEQDLDIYKEMLKNAGG